MELTNQTSLTFRNIHPSLYEIFEKVVLMGYRELLTHAEIFGNHLPEFPFSNHEYAISASFEEAFDCFKESHIISFMEAEGLKQIDEVTREELDVLAEEDLYEDGWLLLDDILKVFDHYDLFYIVLTRAGFYGQDMLVHYENTPLQSVW